MAEDPAILAGTFASRRMLARSEKSMEDILVAFDVMAERMLDGDNIPVAELAKARTALGQVRSQLLEEVYKHEKRVLLSQGLLADAPLDFDELRREIGSSLDRIRSARDAEGIPGEPVE